jgi:hypothetical protein
VAEVERRIRRLERQGRTERGASATFFAGASRQRPKPAAMTVGLVAREATIELRADALLDLARATMLVLLRDGIMAGVRPDTGAAQPPLGAEAASVERRSKHRGYRSGELALGLRSPQMTGSKVSTTARILPPVSRNAYVGKEAAHGVFFLLVGKKHEKVLQGVTEAFVKNAVAKAASGAKSGLQPLAQRTSGDED